MGFRPGDTSLAESWKYYIEKVSIKVSVKTQKYNIRNRKGII